VTHKDGYGIWYSTQATENVLEAITAAMAPAMNQSGERDAAVLVNGRQVSTIKISPARSRPLTIELPHELHAGINQVQVVRASDGEPLNAALRTTYWLPSTASPGTSEEALVHGDTRALRLKVRFDRTEVKPGDAIRCAVEAERIGFRGYGMMLGEIGLPPGADVDRATLEKARDLGQINNYEIQPDKVVLYLWPQAGGSKLEFQFRLRYRMEAMSGSSLLYDYYNPDANAFVKAVRFVVR
jgi:A-macroglobulin receptor binding domain